MDFCISYLNTLLHLLMLHEPESSLTNESFSSICDTNIQDRFVENVLISMQQTSPSLRIGCPTSNTVSLTPVLFPKRWIAKQESGLRHFNCPNYDPDKTSNPDLRALTSIFTEQKFPYWFWHKLFGLGTCPPGLAWIC